jgi:glutathione S-transferase
MKLYTLNHSPYSTRVRAQIRYKGLPIKFVSPPELRGEALKNTFPLGQLPVLEIAGGELLGESTVILNYLEEVYPQRPLRGESALDKARANMMLRWSDTHLASTVTEIMRRAKISGSSSPRDSARSVREQLTKFNQLIISQPDYREREVHIGDFCAVISLSYVQALYELCGHTSLFEDFPLFVDWWHHNLQSNPSLLHSVNEMLLATVEWLPVTGKLDAYPDQGLLHCLALEENVA